MSGVRTEPDRYCPNSDTRDAKLGHQKFYPQAKGHAVRFSPPTCRALVRRLLLSVGSGDNRILSQHFRFDAGRFLL